MSFEFQKRPAFSRTTGCIHGRHLLIEFGTQCAYINVEFHERKCRFESIRQRFAKSSNRINFFLNRWIIIFQTKTLNRKPKFVVDYPYNIIAQLHYGDGLFSKFYHTDESRASNYCYLAIWELQFAKELHRCLSQLKYSTSY